jgi:hypothetical protein
VRLELLRIAAFCAYLGAWIILALGAIANAIPKRRQPRENQPGPASIAGTVLQVISAPLITLTLSDQPLRPALFEQIGAVTLSPLGAFVFIWALASAGWGSSNSLVTNGAMLIATGLLASAGTKLIWASAIYLAGAELRISEEEKQLSKSIGAEYERYRSRTRWRYLPGLR